MWIARGRSGQRGRRRSCRRCCPGPRKLLLRHPSQGSSVCLASTTHQCTLSGLSASSGCLQKCSYCCCGCDVCSHLQRGPRPSVTLSFRRWTLAWLGTVQDSSLDGQPKHIAWRPLPNEPHPSLTEDNCTASALNMKQPFHGLSHGVCRHAPKLCITSLL